MTYGCVRSFIFWKINFYGVLKSIYRSALLLWLDLCSVHFFVSLLWLLFSIFFLCASFGFFYFNFLPLWGEKLHFKWFSNCLNSFLRKFIVINFGFLSWFFEKNSDHKLMSRCIFYSGKISFLNKTDTLNFSKTYFGVVLNLNWSNDPYHFN